MTDSPHAHGWFCRVMVTGIGVIDPETDVDWVPIVRPDGELTLLDPALIVTTEPAEAGEDAETEHHPRWTSWPARWPCSRTA
jgi:hypothetical protein